MRTIGLVAICLIANLSAEAPWGKDADLLYPQKQASCAKMGCGTPVFGAVGESLIQFHQDVISPADGPRSHFLPSSSQYTLDAMRCYGFFTGVMMGCDRLMRENQERWVYRVVTGTDGQPIKWNPVRIVVGN